MAARRTAINQLLELIRGHRLGSSGRTLARRLRMGRDTVRQYLGALASAGLLEGPADALPDAAAVAEVVAGLSAAEEVHEQPLGGQAPVRATVARRRTARGRRRHPGRDGTPPKKGEGGDVQVFWPNASAQKTCRLKASVITKIHALRGTSRGGS